MTAPEDMAILSLDPIGPLEQLREAGEDGGDLMGYYMRGHVDRYEFAQAVNAETGASPGFDYRYCDGGDMPGRLHGAEHVWWRTVPIGGQPGFTQFHQAVPGSRGAWKATVWEWSSWQYQRILGMADTIRRERVRAFSEGVNWAVGVLNFSNPDLADKIIGAFRHRREEIEEGAGNGVPASRIARW